MFIPGFNYVARDWYWVVAESATDVWSSKLLNFVPVTDATYVAWLDVGNTPTQIYTASDLAIVMFDHVLPNFTTSLAITSTGTPQLDGSYACDTISTANITALSTGIAAGKPLPGGGTTFRYADINGGMHAFTSSNFLDFAQAVEDYLYNLNQTFLSNLEGGSDALPATTITIA